jgi:GT2 family glycosyltransferase
MDLSIIIVNWNSLAYLRHCLASIELGARRFSREIIVVDNASYDGSGDLVRNEFTGVKFVQSTENLGFARANNLGYEHSSGRTLLFLNPDTEVKPGALDRMVEQLQSAPELGGVGARLFNSDGSLQTTCLQAYPTVWGQLIDTDYLRRAFPNWHIWGMRPLFSSDPISDDVAMISGACLMVKREVFEQVGLFSPEYFMYGDDLDLCFKIKQAGYRLRYVGSAEVVHHGGQSVKHSSDTGFADVMTRQSIYQFLRRYRGKFYAQTYRSTTGIVAIIRLLILTLFRFISGRGETANITRSKRKWHRIFRWTIGKETWASDYTPPVVVRAIGVTKD